MRVVGDVIDAARKVRELGDDPRALAGIRAAQDRIKKDATIKAQTKPTVNPTDSVQTDDKPYNYVMGQ